MTPALTVKKPAGVLFDAKGRVCFRFAGFEAGETIDVPAYVDGFHGVEWCDSLTPGQELNRPIEAQPGHPNLPDPTPPTAANARQRPDDVDNPQADAFEGTRT